jgi:hypothetical protein
MSDTDIAPQEATNPETEAEELLTEADAEDTTEEEPSDAAKELERARDINRQLLARLRKERDAKKTVGTTSPKTDDGDIRSTVQSLKLAEDKRQFGYEHGLSPEEADAVFRINPKPTKETLDDPFVKGGLQAIRARKRAESNTPPLAGRSPAFALPKKENLTSDDKQEAYEKFKENFLKARRG